MPPALSLRMEITLAVRRVSGLIGTWGAVLLPPGIRRRAVLSGPLTLPNPRGKDEGERTMMIPLERAFLCPGVFEGVAHITDNAICCECGNSNLASLAKILDREQVAEAFLGQAYTGICADLPTIAKLFS